MLPWLMVAEIRVPAEKTTFFVVAVFGWTFNFDLWRQLAILSGAVIVSYIFAELTERRRPALRAWLRRLAQNEKRHRKDATALSNASS